MKQTRTQEQRFFPWTHEDHGLGLAIVGGTLDARRIEGIDRRSRVLDLTTSWERARLERELRARRRVVRRVVAKHERDRPPVAVLLALRCQATCLRRQIGLRDWAEGTNERLDFELVLEREQLAGTVEIDAFLVRTEPLTGQGGGVASRRGARLASARPWIVQIDQPPARSGNYLDVQYRSFCSDPSVPASLHATLYRLDLERDDPILFLNADHTLVRAVLDNKGTRGRRPRVRELLYERIEAGVWSQLILRASARLVEDGELVYAWEHAILEQWLPRLYPDRADDASRRHALERDYPNLPGLLAKLDGVIQASGQLALTATKLVDEL